MIENIIEINTGDLEELIQFMYHEDKKNAKELWSDERKKKLCRLIFSNFDCLVYKYKFDKKDTPKDENEMKTENGEELLVNIKIVREFVELVYEQLNGESIRNYLREDYYQEKEFDDKICFY